MAAEFNDWKVKDLLLSASLDMKDDFFWQSHTLSHQARDNLGQLDCESEDGGKNFNYSMYYTSCSLKYYVPMLDTPEGTNGFAVCPPRL